MAFIKEIGGPLSLELPLTGEEYFQQYDEQKRLIRLDCGRSACEYAVLHAKPNRVWLPVYNCETIENRFRKYLLKRYNCEILFYNIDEDYLPLLPNTTDKEMVVWVNFYGTQPREKLLEIEKKYPLLLIDNTQAFFEQPLKNAYNAYSCRKFFGVSEGGYLVLPQGTECKTEIELQESKTPELSLYLLTSLEFGGNAVYPEFKKCQAVFSEYDMARMSNITKYILCHIDYEQIKKKRLSNFETINRRLQGYNHLNVSENGSGAFRYPLLCEDEGLRSYLLSHKIYVARWWNETLNDSRANEFERYLANYLLPIPMDQRYSVEDMNYIADLIDDYMKGK